MKFLIEVSDQRINDLLFGHMGRYSSWLQEVRFAGTDDRLRVAVTYDREDDDEGTFSGHKVLLYVDLCAGIQKFANDSEYAHQWAQFLNEDDDDITFDVAWQFIIFGKVIYS